MPCTTVHNQAELDQALTDHATCIHIDSPAGVWIQLRGNSRVAARGNSRVEAWDNSSVEAWDNSSVAAWDNSSVAAWDNSSVAAWDNSRVAARGNSRVEAWGNSSVEAWDNSSVAARGNSSVAARGNSSVAARGAAGVHSYDRATVNASRHVAVHVHSGQATVAGGVLIDLTQLNLDDPATWCDHHGVTVREDGMAVLYKAVDAELTAGHGYNITAYPLGGEVTAKDWRDNNNCGYGLHVSPTPAEAGRYSDSSKPRFLRVVAPVASLRPISGDKCKVPSLRVEAEVDRWREEIAPAEATGEQVPA